MHKFNARDLLQIMFYNVIFLILWDFDAAKMGKLGN